MLNTTLLSGITLVIISSLLGGCGGSDTKIVEREPVPILDDHNPDGEVHGQGRLLISTKDQAKVNVIDISEKKVLQEISVSETPSALYASPSHRYGFIVQRTADRVDLVDSGLWQEDHGDHPHDYERAPALMAFNTKKTRPTHFTVTDNQSVIFYDGNIETTTPAAVGVFTEKNIADNTAGTWLEYSTHMHGAAQARGDYLVSTLRDGANALPDRVAVYRAHNGFYVDENILPVTCPGLHGSAQNEDKVAFGCTDGVLVVTQNGDTFSASKIANPASFTGAARIGTLFGHEATDEFIGISAGQFFVINTRTKTITAIEWVNAAAIPTPTAIGYGFADDGELFVLLDNLGGLTILDTTNWSVKNRVQTLASDPGALPTGSRFELALTPGHMVYVSDPVTSQIKQINLNDAKVIETIQLNFIPNKVTWLGIAEPATKAPSH